MGSGGRGFGRKRCPHSLQRPRWKERCAGRRQTGLLKTARLELIDAFKSPVEKFDLDARLAHARTQFRSGTHIDVALRIEHGRRNAARLPP